MTDATAQTTSPAPRPVSSHADAEFLVKHLLDVMDALLGTVDEETQLVRAGKLKEAADLESSKADLSRLYIADTLRLRASQDYLKQSVPEMLERLRRRHEEFRALLQINLTVLATAHAVSESIMRGVSDEMARKATLQGYGASGRATAPSSCRPAAAGHQPGAVAPARVGCRRAVPFTMR